MYYYFMPKHNIILQVEAKTFLIHPVINCHVIITSLLAVMHVIHRQKYMSVAVDTV